MTTYRIVLPYACYGIEVDERGMVTDAAPIARWMVGKSWASVQGWLSVKGGTWSAL